MVGPRYGSTSQSADMTAVDAIYVPFRYDLGGRVVAYDRLLDALREQFTDVGIDAAATRSFNLSYLAHHTPVLKADVSDIEVILDGCSYEVDRRVTIHPWLGAASVDCYFLPKAPLSPEHVLRFYDELVNWKNEDYLPYLDRAGQMTAALRERSGYGANPGWAGPIAEQVDALRQLTRDLIEPRPARYEFHDFRVVVMSSGALPSADEIEALLRLEPNAVHSSELNSRTPEVTLGNVTCWSSGWATWIHTTGTDVSAARELVGLLDLVHAQWFLCQCWIYVFDADDRLDQPGNGGQLERLRDLANSHLLLGRDLTEIDNLDLMLKDPARIRAATYLIERFGVERHRAAAGDRLKLLEHFHTEQMAYQSTRDAQRLQLLFSISAAAAVAALIPAVASIEGLYAVTTLVFALLLWVGFVFNFAVLARRLGQARRQRRRRPRRFRR